jgi:hypothetical protein
MRHESIFGPVMSGVPSPIVPHEHPYPTRYHGANWQYVDTRQTFVPSIYSRGWVPRPYSVGENPDGIGVHDTAVVDAALGQMPTMTGSKVVDAVAGAVVGWIASPSEKEQIVYAIGGALAGWGLGLFGICGVLGVSVAQLKGKAHAR